MTIQDRMNDFVPTFLYHKAMTQTTSHKYFVGDLCYVMHDEWSEVCDLTLGPEVDEEDVYFELADGRPFILMGTAYGDGEYYDQFGNRYPVDSGTIGAVKVDDLKSEELAEALKMNLGAIHEFPYALDAYDAENDEGVLRIGSVTIDTAGPSYDDPEEEEGEEP